MIEELAIPSPLLMPGMSVQQDRGGSGRIADSKGNVIIYSNSTTGSNQFMVNSQELASSITITGKNPPIGIKTEIQFPSNNFQTLNWSQTIDPIVVQSYTTSSNNIIIISDSGSLQEQLQEPITVLSSSMEITGSENIIVEYLPDLEDSFFSLYEDQSMESGAYFGISVGEELAIQKNSTTIKIRGKNKKVILKPSDINPPPTWGNLSKLNYTNALSNINSFPSLNNFSKSLKLIAAITATQEGWGSPTSTQRILHNPGNLRGEGDLGQAEVGNIGFFANFSTYDKGWAAMMNSIQIMLGGNDRRLNYESGTKRINWFIAQDNDWLKSKNIPFKIQKSYSSKNGTPPTFRQFYNIYAPWGDNNNPTTYAASVVYTLSLFLKKTVNIDDYIKDYL